MDNFKNLQDTFRQFAARKLQTHCDELKTRYEKRANRSRDSSNRN